MAVLGLAGRSGRQGLGGYEQARCGMRDARCEMQEQLTHLLRCSDYERYLPNPDGAARPS